MKVDIGHERQLWSEGLYSCSYIDYGMESQQQLQQTSELGNISEGQPPQETEIPNSIQKAENPHIKEYEDFLKSGIKKLCKCGCGEKIVIIPYHKYEGISTYIRGHHSEETKKKKRERLKNKNYEEIYGLEKAIKIKNKMNESRIGEKNSMYGKHHSEETKKIMSELKKGKRLSQEHITKIILATKNKKYSQEHNKKISETRKRLFAEGKLIFSKEHRNNLSKSQMGRVCWSKGLTKNDNAIIKRNSELKKILWKNPEFRKKVINAMNMPEVKLKQSEHAKKLWSNPEWAEKTIKATLKSLFKRPTSYEKKIIDLCLKHNLPFIYKGNGGFLINFKNPDFVNEQARIVIEVYWSWFKIKDYGSVENYKEYCRQKYEPAGWKVLFLDENDVLSEDWENICLNKITQVMKVQD